MTECEYDRVLDHPLRLFIENYRVKAESCVMVPLHLDPIMIQEVDEFVENNPHLGYRSCYDFIRDAVRHRLFHPTKGICKTPASF